MAKKFAAWWSAHKPTTRRLIQVYAALLYNAYVKGFIKGDIYTGGIKNFCVPGFNCYSCPGAIGRWGRCKTRWRPRISARRTTFWAF